MGIFLGVCLLNSSVWTVVVGALLWIVSVFLVRYPGGESRAQGRYDLDPARVFCARPNIGRENREKYGGKFAEVRHVPDKTTWRLTNRQ